MLKICHYKTTPGSRFRVSSGPDVYSSSSTGSAGVITRRWRQRCLGRLSGCCSSSPSCSTWSRPTCTRRCWPWRDESSAAKRPWTEMWGGRGGRPGPRLGLRPGAGAGVTPGRHRDDERQDEKLSSNLRKKKNHKHLMHNLLLVRLRTLWNLTSEHCDMHQPENQSINRN